MLTKKKNICSIILDSGQAINSSSGAEVEDLYLLERQRRPGVTYRSEPVPPTIIIIVITCTYMYFYYICIIYKVQIYMEVMYSIVQVHTTSRFQPSRPRAHPHWQHEELLVTCSDRRVVYFDWICVIRPNGVDNDVTVSSFGNERMILVNSPDSILLVQRHQVGGT